GARAHRGERHPLRFALAHLRVPRPRDGRPQEARALRREPAVPEPGHPPRDRARSGPAARGDQDRRRDPARVRRNRGNPTAPQGGRRSMNRIHGLILGVSLAGLTLTSPAPARDDPPPRVVEIHAKRFEFEPKEIHVAKGESVTLAVTSEDVTHGFFSRAL